MATRTLSVVFTDIKGFTQRTSSSSRAALRALLDRHEELLLPVIEHYQGTVVKTIGDAFLLTFESPTNAVLCGLMIQETLHEANARSAEAVCVRVNVWSATRGFYVWTRDLHKRVPDGCNARRSAWQSSRSC